MFLWEEMRARKLDFPKKGAGRLCYNECDRHIATQKRVQEEAKLSFFWERYELRSLIS